MSGRREVGVDGGVVPSIVHDSVLVRTLISKYGKYPRRGSFSMTLLASV